MLPSSRRQELTVLIRWTFPRPSLRGSSWPLSAEEGLGGGSKPQARPLVTATTAGGASSHYREGRCSVVRCAGSGTRLPGCVSWLCCFLAV